MYSNNILNFQESTTILNACTKKSGNLLKALRILNIYDLVWFMAYQLLCNHRMQSQNSTRVAGLISNGGGIMVYTADET